MTEEWDFCAKGREILILLLQSKWFVFITQSFYLSQLSQKRSSAYCWSSRCRRLSACSLLRVSTIHCTLALNTKDGRDMRSWTTSLMLWKRQVSLRFDLTLLLRSNQLQLLSLLKNGLSTKNGLKLNKTNIFFSQTSKLLCSMSKQLKNLVLTM